MKKEIKENNSKPIYKKWWFWVLIILFIGILSPDNNTNSTTTDNTSQVSAQKEYVSEYNQEENKSIEANKEVIQVEESTPSAEETNVSTSKYVVKTDDVMNGLKTEVIGEYAYTEVKKSELTNEVLFDIYKKEIENKNYNWFTIKFEDGTGIVFGGCLSYGEYGNIGQDGCTVGESRSIMPTYDADGNINGFELYKYMYEKLGLSDEEIRTIGKEWTDATTHFEDIDEMNDNIDNVESKYMNKYSISEDEARELLENCEYWNLYN